MSNGYHISAKVDPDDGYLRSEDDDDDT